ncbi:MAG: tRNA (adenosine(37)-N6)-threonylcarbamoyltransferase complex ATPase subunit type 1 TsaE [Pikeienuella sp.]
MKPEQTTNNALFLANAEATDNLGQRLASLLRAGDTVFLIGDLGAGKTALARAVISAKLDAVGLAEDIPSPTFTLVQTYEADLPIWHADLYRLTGPEEAEELGLADAMEDSIVLIEWPDRLADLTPERRLEVSLDFSADGEGRIASLTPFGDGWAGRIEALTND